MIARIGLTSTAKYNISVALSMYSPRNKKLKTSPFSTMKKVTIPIMVAVMRDSVRLFNSVRFIVHSSHDMAFHRLRGRQLSTETGLKSPTSLYLHIVSQQAWQNVDAGQCKGRIWVVSGRPERSMNKLPEGSSEGLQTPIGGTHSEILNLLKTSSTMHRHMRVAV